jgi:hypothetical protein
MPTGYDPTISDTRKIAFQRRANFRRLIATAEQHFENRRFEAAAAAFHAASQLEVGEAAPILNRALSLQMLGRVDEAVANYQRIRFGPLRLQTCLNLTTIDPGLVTEAETTAMREAAESPDTTPDLRTKLWFALGYVREHLGKFDDAFAAFAEGNRLRSGAADLARAEAAGAETLARIRKDFTPAAVARWSGHGHPSAAPIFIVGMPRSGATLIEQILASHPQVFACGETQALERAISGQVQWPPAGDPGESFRKVAGDYLRLIRALGWDHERRFVDKTPLNYLTIGSIALTFPRATILHSVRDPIDTCLSWYRHKFPIGHEASYDLAATGRAYVRYRHVMDHWNEVLPGRVIEVRHETLVADPALKIRELVSETCALPWNDACLRFHETERFVDTPSALQVRKPIFDTSIGRWKRYKRHLGPLIEALGPYARKTR